MLKNTLISFDERRDLYIASDTQSAIAFAVEHWIHTAMRSIQQRGRFAVALSGGSTPKAIYQGLCHVKEIDWNKVWLFWSDERSVPPSHPESNYTMAMTNGLGSLPIPPAQIFRMKAEEKIQENACDYEEKIFHSVGPSLFDLVMLGIGEDGHTASLFPKTDALEAQTLVAAVFVPQNKTWRMSFTLPCINQSRQSVIYALGRAKQEIVPQVLHAAIQSPWPASAIGTPAHKALWILDSDAAQRL